MMTRAAHLNRAAQAAHTTQTAARPAIQRPPMMIRTWMTTMTQPAQAVQLSPVQKTPKPISNQVHHGASPLKPKRISIYFVGRRMP